MGSKGEARSGATHLSSSFCPPGCTRHDSLAPATGTTSPGNPGQQLLLLLHAKYMTLYLACDFAVLAQRASENKLSHFLYLLCAWGRLHGWWHCCCLGPWPAAHCAAHALPGWLHLYTNAAALEPGPRMPQQAGPVPAGQSGWHDAA
ncbi:hypothetical protein mRhiFer1_009426 [Rhinolophus ferrumequinum]|uniref:Uncharacterized protein n=1 Tax=Rhinolophus ferrumequinum TaxID=59479 RepID=A0A7J7RIN8_RHIFE|nr:hypothetical protein mRhiFer1_009426 [Rhinolophus ferrumequinum]